ncbi:kelch domain-containing protein [Diaporthe amygdali]|uniref:kelch domain-containing protein n=1 Tax=Phomopsis amygdali TaxID=1214568 RepID=UPI0022FF0B48|nr:kelch domain-containing protein [Diaporthe amygdali]KAJ0119140.1 kelch domain-containing protein [Diaporthe amygdali]
METFGSLKRRTTDLMSQAQGQVGNIPRPNLPNLPSMPNMPSMPANFPNLSDLSSRLPKMPAFATGAAHTGLPTQKATWERIDVPPMPRSSHSINVIAGSAYIFGGEIRPREPVDNDMHVITLPFSSAGADYYAVKAKAVPKSEIPQVPTVIAPSEDGNDDTSKEKDLSEVPLSTPAEEKADVVTGSENINDGPDPSSSKGKEPAHADFDRSTLGDVPSPRVGHATAVIGNRIFLFGGRGGPEMAPLEEHGRVWVFDTKTHLWSYLDPLLPAAGPISPAFADKRHHYPAARSYHSAVGIDQPRDFNTRDTKTATWAEWAQGDSNVVGTPQRPIVGNVANNSRDEDDDGYGTLIVHGGCFVEGRANDTWAFDVRSRVWQELPSAPGKPRGGTSLGVAGSRLWRFGGFNGEGEEGGQLDYLELGVDSFENVSSEADVVLSARGQWKSVFPELADSPAAPLVAAAEAEAAGEDEAAVPLKAEADPRWPGNRSVAGMQTVTIGGAGGREYLILMLGERDPSDAGHEAAGKFWDDIWAYELPKATAASSVMGIFNRGRSGSKGQERPVEGKWFRVETEAYDDEDDAAAQGPGPRGWFATAHMGELEERGIVIWGGLDGANKRLGDGWILRLGAEKREP